MDWHYTFMLQITTTFIQKYEPGNITGSVKRQNTAPVRGQISSFQTFMKIYMQIQGPETAQILKEHYLRNKKTSIKPGVKG